MKTKNILATTTAAVILTAGTFAVAQDTTPRATTPATPPATERVAPPAAAPSNQSAALAPGTLHQVKGDTAAAMAPGLNISAKDLSGMDVYGSDGKKIGDVDKVLGDSSNNIKAVTMDVGGFLGIGAREVVLPIDKLQKGTEKNRLQVSMSKDDINNLTKWEDPDRKAATPGGTR